MLPEAQRLIFSKNVGETLLQWVAQLGYEVSVLAGVLFQKLLTLLPEVAEEAH